MRQHGVGVIYTRDGDLRRYEAIEAHDPFHVEPTSPHSDPQLAASPTPIGQTSASPIVQANIPHLSENCGILSAWLDHFSSGTSDQRWSRL